MKHSIWVMVLCASVQAADLRQAIADRVDVAKKAVGIVAGTLGPGGREILVHGCADRNCEQKLTKDSVFEIGSITKVFTALLLADMVERGEVKPDDPVSKFLPEHVTVPIRNGRQITLLHLATHFSGLPRIPGNLKTTDLTNPYAYYDAPKLYEFLSSYTLPRDPGEKYEYSNLGVGLLGHALSLKAGRSYEELIRERILKPLKMNATFLGAKRGITTGHAGDLKPVIPWDFQVLAPAGAIRSTAGDMLTFAAAHLGLTETPLKAAIAWMRTVQRPTGAPDIDQAIGWLVLKKHGTEILFHDGGTAGFRSVLALDPAKKRAVVVLANTFTEVNDIALHTLEPKYTLAKATPPRKEVEVSEETLDSYVGEYQLAPTFSIRIFRKGKQLMGQATNQPAFEMFPESETKFFLKVVDAQITFTKDDTGKVNGLILHQGGRDQKAIRTSSAPRRRPEAVAFGSEQLDVHVHQLEAATGGKAKRDGSDAGEAIARHLLQPDGWRGKGCVPVLSPRVGLAKRLPCLNGIGSIGKELLKPLPQLISVQSRESDGERDGQVFDDIPTMFHTRSIGTRSGRLEYS